MFIERTYLLFQFPFYFKSFKRDIIVLISFLILFVSISFLVNIGKNVPSGVPYRLQSSTTAVQMLWRMISCAMKYGFMKCIRYDFRAAMT